MYVLDMSYDQFVLKYGGTYVRIYDARFGGIVGSEPGYWLMNMKDGEKFTEEIIKKGYFKATPQKLKMYGDSFFLALKAKEDEIGRPIERELITPFTGEQYMERIISGKFEEEIDFSKEDLERDGYDLSTPLSNRITIVNTSNIPKSEVPSQIQKNNKGEPSK